MDTSLNTKRPASDGDDEQPEASNKRQALAQADEDRPTPSVVGYVLRCAHGYTR